MNALKLLQLMVLPDGADGAAVQPRSVTGGTDSPKSAPTSTHRAPSENGSWCCKTPHKQAEVEQSAPSSTHECGNYMCMRAHDARAHAHTRASFPQTRVLEGAAAKSATEHANKSRTFARSERAQEPPRWRVYRTSDDELDALGIREPEPWGVFVDAPSSELGLMLFVDAFLTHAEAVAFADRQARS